ncbi:MAG: CAAD domain-containing protein, partial [Cyanobacteria bacterium P01_F01_bin.42]
QMLGEGPGLLAQFFKQNSRGMITLLAGGIGIIILSVLSSVIQTLNHVPLLGRSLELIGLTVTLLFVVQRLIWQDSRQDLLQSLGNQRDRILNRIQRGDDASSKSSSSESKVESASESDSKSMSSSQAERLEEYEVTADIESQFELIIGVIRTVRNLRAEANIKPSLKITAILQSERGEERQILENGRAYIQDTGRLEALEICETVPDSLTQTIVGVIGTVQVLVPLSGVVDVETLKAKVEKDLGKAEGDIKSLQGRLNNQKFVANAPAEIVQGARDALVEAETQAEILRDRLKQLET